MDDGRLRSTEERWQWVRAILRQAYGEAGTLAARLQTMRKAIVPGQSWLREDLIDYTTNSEHEPWSD
jgi:hypothetical protein